MSPDQGFRVIDHRRVYDGYIVNIDIADIAAPDGEVVRREIVRHPGSVAVLPFDGSDVVLLRQYRAPVGEAVWEIPAGLLDVEGEAPEDAAARECVDEVGYWPGRLTVIDRYYASAGISDEVTIVYLGEQLDARPPQPGHAEERAAEIARIPFRDALRMAETGEIIDAKTLIALYWLASRTPRP